MEETIQNNNNYASKSFGLQLGDIILITDNSNEQLNGNTFFIDYIDNSKIKLINVDDLSVYELNLNENKTIDNSTISTISLLSRNDEPGYAKQHNLLPNTWVNVYFGGDVPMVITGEITNLEGDMIEIKTYPSNDIIYLNFDYKGIPLNLPIELIEIRDKIIKPIEEPNVVEQEANPDANPDAEEQYEPGLPQDTINVKTQFREFIINPNQVEFGREEYGPIVQLIDVDANRERYSIETQSNDLLDDLLSTIPTFKRTNVVLNNIHTTIERYKQLRTIFSIFDEYGNVLNPYFKESKWKPLTKYFEKFNQNLYWILPNVKNVKKLYIENESTENEYNTVEYIDLSQDLEDIHNIFTNYKNNSQNTYDRYSTLFTELNPHFTPFNSVESESKYGIIHEKSVESDINVIVYDINDKETQPLFTKYNTGLQKLNAFSLSGNRMITTRENLTNPDILQITSFVTLPEPTIRFSRVNLPNTSLLDKSNLNINFLNYWQLFKQNKFSVNNIIVDNLDQELDFNENNFVNNIKNFVLNLPEKEIKSNYTKFIDTIIPKTRVLFNLMKKYIIGKLSIVDVVSYLEPFLIYSDDLTYNQYKQITDFINEQITEYNKTLIEKSKVLQEFKRINERFKIKNRVLPLINILSTKDNLSDVVFETYDFTDKYGNVFTNSELLKKMVFTDFGNLYNTAITLDTLSLIFPTSINNILESELDKKTSTENNSDKCKNYIIAKQYFDLSDLENDNDTDIYFDKQYDTTNYGILDNYEKEIVNMPPEIFMGFLIEKLKTTLKLNETESEYLADTLINGYKRVLDGTYAVLNYVPLNPETQFKMAYYVRKNNKWILDDSVDNNIISDNQNILCNLQIGCVSSSDKIDDKCESLKTSGQKIQKKILTNILNEFDEKYEISKVEFETAIRKMFDYYLYINPVLSKLHYFEMLKYNEQKYNIGTDNTTPIDESSIISPYFKLRDLILKQPDFTQKQTYILKFVASFTRQPYVNIDEDPTVEPESEHWLYCVNTNVKLLPLFLFKLATAFFQSADSYNNTLQLIIKDIGARSDDGDSWVDKHSGYVITRIDFEVEEEYSDSGFLVKSRDVLQQSVGDTLTLSNKNLKIFDSPEFTLIYNIINELSFVMGVNIDTQTEYIINVVSNVIKEKITSEEAYTKDFNDAMNKGKPIPSYKELYNTIMLYTTAGLFLICVQTSIPPVKTRKTYPGCVKSFEGYPFEGAGDLQSVNYLACVLYKLKSKKKPWNVLERKKEAAIANLIKIAIDNYLLPLTDIVRKFNEKTEYLLKNQETVISDEYKITNWKQFLPPLVEIKIKNLANITTEFKKSLFDYKKASFNKGEKTLIIESKIIKFSLAIQEKIQQVINSEKLLLLTSDNRPYVENACCNENTKMTTIEYFKSKNADISIFNGNVEELTNVLNEIYQLSNGLLFSNKINTKNVYPKVSTNFSEQTIYTAFILYCHFKTPVPINKLLLPLCNVKPEYINFGDSNIEIIRKLKQDGKTYSTENFLRLLQLISGQNMINVEITTRNIPEFSRLNDLLTAFNSENEEVIEPELQKLIHNLINKNNEDNAQTRNINNYLIKQNNSIKIKVVEYIAKNANLTKKNMSVITKFINTLNDWEGYNEITDNATKISNDSLYNIVQFFKTYIQNLSVTFPNMILNKTSHIMTPNWPFAKVLSSRHYSDIQKVIKEYSEKLIKYHEDLVLLNILQTIQKTTLNILKLSQELQSFTSTNSQTIFNERTSKFLFEHLFLKVCMNYIELSQDTKMIVREKTTRNNVDDVYSVENTYSVMNSTVYNLDINTIETNVNVIQGNQKQLKQKVAELLSTYIQIMSNHKSDVDTSYELIMDKIFKLKEKEKDTFTDRLKELNDEEREADTILKINKLGVWNKGLQKGLTKYVGEYYDEEIEMDKQQNNKKQKLENMLGKNKNVNDGNMDIYVDDLMEQQEIDDEIDRENYDMSRMTEDYNDGDYDGYENGNDDYDDYN